MMVDMTDEEAARRQMDIQALLAGLMGYGIEPKDIIKRYLSALTEGGLNEFQDPLYPHVNLFKRRDGTVHGYVIKERDSKEEARREVEALCHWARQNEIIFGEPHYLPLVSVGSFILSPYVGPEVYLVEHQLSDRITRLADKNKNKVDSLTTFRRALVLRQVDMLACAVVDPFIPLDEGGHVIVSNKDIIGSYKNNMRTVLRTISQWTEAERDDPLDKALDVLTGFFIPSYKQRYVDTYSRNLCFRVKKADPVALLHVTLDDILDSRDNDHNERTLVDTFTRDMLFLHTRLVQVDLHRNEKEELRGECLANIIEAPGLLTCDAKGYAFGEEEKINAVARFELRLEIEREAAKGNERRRDYLNLLYREIEKTNEGRYTLTDIRQLLAIETGCPAHYQAMSFYKAVRWLGYINEKYIPRYEAVVAADPKNPLAGERLTYCRQDREVYKATALESLHILMDELYEQLPKAADSFDNSAARKIVLNHTRDSEHRIPYIVRRERNTFQFLSGVKQKLFLTDNSFKHHINQIDTRAKTPEEKIYGTLLKLGYLDYILAKA